VTLLQKTNDSSRVNLNRILNQKTRTTYEPGVVVLTVGLQPKGQVSVLCNLGLAEKILQIRTPGVFAHDVLGSVGDRDLRLCVGVRIADGVCNKEICWKDRACAGDA
jgi:hypothetical protein